MKWEIFEFSSISSINPIFIGNFALLRYIKIVSMMCAVNVLGAAFKVESGFIDNNVAKTWANGLGGIIFIGERYHGYSIYILSYNTATKVAGMWDWGISMNGYYLTIQDEIACEYLLFYTNLA